MTRKWLAIGIILLFVGTCIIPFISFCSAESDEYYFEDVNVLVIGRARTIGSDGTWINALYRGKISNAEVHVGVTWREKVKIIVFNESARNPEFSQSKLSSIVVGVHNAEGIFFWACWTQYSAGPFPPIVFAYCHAEELWIY